LLSPVFWPNSLYGSSSTNDIDQDDHDGDHQKYVN
jgi:hypothetical protein